MKSDVVSIIIPAFNSELYIKQCLRSALSQTYKNLEIIVVDDGSTDKTVQICSEILDERLVVYSQMNSGVSAARNNGLKKAVGGYVMFLDSDDTLEPDAVEIMLSLMKKNNCDIVCGSYRLIKTRNRRLEHCYITETIFVDYKSDVLQLLKKITNAPWAKLYKKEIINEVEFPVNVPIAEDSIFLTKILGLTKTISLTNSVVYNYSFYNGESAVNKYYPDFYEYMILWKKEMMTISNECGMKYNIEKIDDFLFDLCLDHYIKNKKIKILKKISGIFKRKHLCREMLAFYKRNFMEIFKSWIKRDVKKLNDEKNSNNNNIR